MNTTAESVVAPPILPDNFKVGLIWTKVSQLTWMTQPGFNDPYMPKLCTSIQSLNL